MAARPGEKRKKTEAPHKLKPRIRKNGNNRNKKSKNNPNFVPLGKNEVIDQLKDKVQEERRLTKKAKAEAKVQTVFLSTLPAAEQLSFFIDRFQSANGFKMSPLEMEAYKVIDVLHNMDAGELMLKVELLKGRVNIASGTPSRIKKLIDIDALLLSRLALVVLDVQSDAKGYSLFTLPQVSMEFWDLYRSHFNERIIQGSTRICFYGAAELKQPRRSKHGD
ncbi:hypothetical protein HPP92_024563 [Vanilla planifolia]|uniref:Uncharacterized protein n=1 Tax=Vanilla planifolia TaxID=51239 RepID=A0A835PJW0_VANPL|nr:hypothetical protein HPP92_024563 [Vanilla planifolia]